MLTRDVVKATILTVAVVVLALSVREGEGAILGIDYGSQWIKAAVLRPGFFDVVENEVNKRKTSAALAFSKQDNERILGKTALRVLFRNPERAFVHTAELLGKPYSAALARQYHPYATLRDEARGTYVFSLDYSDTIRNISAEEVSGVILQYVKRFSEAYAKTPLTDCVITVKSYATAHEKAALIDAARLAGLNVIGLISAPAAFAVTYGMEKATNVSQNLAIVDMGDASLEVALATVVDAPRKKNSARSTAAVTVRGLGYDPTLGGREFVARLTALLLRKMGLAREITNYADRRAYYRVEAHAEKIMEVLSVNKDALFKISFPERDYEGTVTRNEFEAACTDLVARVAAPVARALADANWTADDVTYVQIVGGATRIPAVQEALKNALGKKVLQRHLSSDEGAAFGAAYLGAHLSTLHRMKKDLALKDISPYGVDVTINGKTLPLFKPGSRYGSKKTLTLHNKDDFAISLAYAKDADIEQGLCRDIINISVSGIPSRANYNLTEDPKLQIQLTLKHTGLIEVTKAHSDIHEIVYVEETVKKQKKKKAKKSTEEDEKKASKEEEEEEHNKKSEEEEKDKKMDEKEKENIKEKEEEKETTKDVKNDNENEKNEEENENNDDDDNNKEEEKNEKEEEEEEEKEKEEDKEDKEDEGDDDEEDEDNKKEEEKKKEEEEVKKILKPVKKFHSIKLKTVTEYLCIRERTPAEVEASRKKLAAFDQADQDRKDLAEAKNNLEEYIFQTRETLSGPERKTLAVYCEPGTLEKIEEDLSAAFAWLEEEEDGEATKISALRDKLRDLRKAGDAILFRKAEAEERPDAIKYLRFALNFTREAIANATANRNISDESIQAKLDKCYEVEKWLDDAVKRQDATPLSKDPAVLISEIEDKADDLKIIVKWLHKQPKKKTPKPATAADAANGSADNNNNNTNTNTTEDRNDTKTTIEPVEPAKGKQAEEKKKDDDEKAKDEL